MRTTAHKKLDDMFLNRWSPRAFLPDPLSDEEIETLFEAARWSPSCFNEQPWRFVFARSPEHLESFQSILADTNRVWASKTPLLIIAFCQKTFTKNNKPNRWCEFDTGAAWMALTLQANKMGLRCHAMGGFDERKAYEVTNVDAEKYTAICVIAVGKKGPSETLPDELQEIEKPNDRRPIDSFIYEGVMS